MKKPPKPIAIVGMSFRFPGDLDTEQKFWSALHEGRDMVGRIGSDRWAVEELEHAKRTEPGRSITFSAGTLSRIKEFDAEFFNISPREAACLDPQQRLLLEMSWEAMENGGQVPERMAGSDCGVYIGISSLDYGVRVATDLAGMSSHSMTGNTMGLAANRLSYVFDLHGPSVAMDTACSSSLVALHHACSSLNNGEIPAALVGSVNMLLHPYPFVGFTKASMISADGRCRAFDADAQGYVRSEGGAVLILKTLEQAEKDGDRIHAVIMGTGVNSDGGRKSGITIPSSDGQAELMRYVLKRAGISPKQVDYIEAHGTGTAVGDPVEARAIGDVYGQGRKKPLPIGSVKTNVGHLETASGMAGLVKVVLMLKQKTLAPSINFSSPNPNIDFKKMNLRVVTKPALLTANQNRRRIMGINSFGFGGTNTHILIGDYARHQQRKTRKIKSVSEAPLFISAQTPAALRAMADAYAERLAEMDAADYYDFAYSAAVHRGFLRERLAVSGTDTADIAAKLKSFAAEEPSPDVVTEKSVAEAADITFVYTGNGAVWAGMGKQLLQENKRFAALMKELDAEISKQGGFSVLEELKKDDKDARLGETSIAQPLLFAMQVAVTRLLAEDGVTPSAVMGHSVGEIAAAWAAGALTLKQAVSVILARSTAQEKSQGKGGMAAVGLSAEDAREAIAGQKCPSVEIACINSPSGITLSGRRNELERLQKPLEARGVFFRLLDIDYAFHSRFMNAILPDLKARLDKLAPKKTRIDFISTVTGKQMTGKALDASYWQKNVRRPVRFSQAMGTLIRSGRRIFVEIGPHAILQRYIKECLAQEGIAGHVMPTLSRQDKDAGVLQKIALRLQLLVPELAREQYFSDAGTFVDLPTYLWQRESHWVKRTNECDLVSERYRVHPLLGWRVKGSAAVWENVLDLAQLPWLADHRVLCAAVFPGAGYVEMALAAAREHFGGDCYEVENIEIFAPIVFDDGAARSVRLEIEPHDGTFRIMSRTRLSDEEWSVNAVGRLLGEPARHAAADMPSVLPVQGVTADKEVHYNLLSGIGLEYGPAFQAVERISVAENTIEGRIKVPETLPDTIVEACLLHPSLLDAAAQAVVHFFRDVIEAGKGYPLLPVRIGRLRYFASSVPARFQIRARGHVRRTLKADIVLFDKDDRIVCMLEAFRFKAAPAQTGKALPAQWIVTPHLAPRLSAPSALEGMDCRALAKKARHYYKSASQANGNYFENGQPLMEALAVSFVYEAFKVFQEDKSAWLQAALEAPEIVPEDRRSFFLWAAQCLKENGLLTENDGLWQVEEDSELPAAEDIWRTVFAEFPQALPELLSAGHIGRHLPALLSDEGFDVSSYSVRRAQLAEQLFDSAPCYAGTSRVLEKIIADIAADWPDDRRLRILQISGGASGLPHRAAAHLPAKTTDYVVATTDKDDLVRLKNEYKDYDFLTAAMLDPETFALGDAAELPQQFDVIIVHHWLHEVARVESALAILAKHQARGGVVILGERVPSWQADFIFGPDPDWWPKRGNAVSCLRSASEWQALLEKQGFVQVEKVGGEDAGTYLLLARRTAVPVAMQSEKESWAFVCDAKQKSPAHMLGKELAEKLKAVGQSVSFLTEKAALSAKDLNGFDNIVYLRGLAGNPRNAGDNRCMGVLKLTQALSGVSPAPRLWLVTAGGALVSSGIDLGEINPSEASVWGLGRVIMNEYPALRCTVIDIAEDIAVENLCEELLFPDSETEVILHGNERYGVRLEHDKHVVRKTPQNQQRFRLDFASSGHLRNLSWMPVAERKLQADEVEVRPVASGLNFRDVMYAMGLLPDEAVENGFLGANLGLEFAGVVSAVGQDVGDIRVGDKVMGFGPASFASHVVTRSGAIMPMPEGWTFAAAATVPTTFFTAYYALKHLANVQPGEKVLIHGAAGGVGLAAIQVANMLGAEIYATAGTEEKRDFVRLLGVEHVFNSRELSFANDIRAIAPEGVDVVLNSLAGEAINRNLDIMRPFGRFLELGKRDFYQNTRIGLRPFRNNISYFGIDVDQLMIAHPTLSARLFKEIVGYFESGDFKPLPYRVYPASNVIDAFRCLQQSRHIGKVVVDFEGTAIAAEQPDETVSQPCFKKNATYLVSGGLGGFGLETAAWFAAHGAGHIALLGRRGMETPGVQEAIARIEALGAKVHVFGCDVADKAQLKAVFAEMKKAGLPPLRGVVHAAMVLEDALLENQTVQSFESVFAPKIAGGWNLHSLTQNLKLDYFILYSSIVTAIGNPGQGNYVAANAYLESLTALRRRKNLPAICVGWGPIGDSGYLTRNTTMKDGLTARLGAHPLTSGQALERLGVLLAEDISQTTVADFSWRAMSAYLPSAVAGRFATLRHTETGDDAASETDIDFLQMIAGKTTDEIMEMIRAALFAEVGKTLSISADRIDPARPLTELGMDSLMMVELALAIEKFFGIRLPAMALNERAISIDSIGKRILEKISGGVNDVAGRDIATLVTTMAAQHAEDLAVDDILNTDDDDVYDVVAESAA